MIKNRLLICLVAAVFLFGCKTNVPSNAPADAPAQTLRVQPVSAVTPHYSNLNGSELKGILVDHPIAIVIENYEPIRNLQKGIEDASIVYESLTEGGITRFLAIFNGMPVNKIGPIRSARPYFLDFADEYKAVFVHIGGSPVALNRLKDDKNLLNIDEKKGEDIIWRSNDELPPHNAFTSIKNIRNAIVDRNFLNSFELERFPFKEPDKIPGDIRHISIQFWNSPYNVKWEYDPETNLYDRYNGGVRHGNISSANIVVQFTDQKVIDNKLRRRINTSGGGNALVFRDGKVIHGSWKKVAYFTKFFYKNGDEIKLNRGQIWIEIVQNSTTVNYF